MLSLVKQQQEYCLQLSASKFKDAENIIQWKATRAHKLRGEVREVGLFSSLKRRWWADLMGASNYLKVNYEDDTARLSLEVTRDDSHKLQVGTCKVRP